MPASLGRSTAIVLGTVLVLGACTDTSPEANDDQALDERCESQVVALVDEVQAYVDGFAGVGAVEFATEPDLPDGTVLSESLDQRREQLLGSGCNPVRTQQLLGQELQRVSGDGGIADAVAHALRLSVLGGRTDTPRDIELGPDDDVAAAAITAPAGSTLTLGPGDYHLDEPILVVQPLVIEGAGDDRSRLTSTAPEAAVIVLDQGALHLADLSVAHDGEATSAVVLVLSTAYSFRDVTVAGGVTSEDGSGGVGVLLEWGLLRPESPTPGERPGRFDRTIAGLAVVDNDGPGLVVTGTATPRIAGAELRNNGLCGICYLGTSGGILEDSRIVGNEVGVAAAGSSAPEVRSNHIADNATDGILVEGAARGTFEDNDVVDNGERGMTVADDGAPTWRSNRVRGNGEAGVAMIDDSRAVLVDTEVADHDIGVWIEGRAQPTVSGNDIGDGDGVGVAVVGEARATVTGNRIWGYAYGIEVRERGSAELSDNQLVDASEVAILLRDEATATGSGNQCIDGQFDVLIADDATGELDGDGCVEPPPGTFSD